MTLTVRKPAIASDTALIDWSPVPEFAHLNNGASATIPYVEHYLNNVMNEVRQHHCADNPALRDEIDLFIRQEAIHARYHIAFNRQMFAAGYEGLKPIIDKAVRDLQCLRETRSLAFNLAYCAGFETTATFSAKYALETCDGYFKGADSYGANLFQWHVAEEFEHRASVHKALHAVSGSYVNRIAGLVYSFWHINKMFGAGAQVILAKYREGMTAEEERRSKRIERRLKIRQFGYLLPRMLRLLSPWYDPQTIEVSPRIRQAMDFFRTMEPILASYADLRDEKRAA